MRINWLAMVGLCAAVAWTPALAETGQGGTVLLNNNHYVNVDGRVVHGPARTLHDRQPVGASAKCFDGTWSFSRHARGTCSHHGGVARWL